MKIFVHVILFLLASGGSSCCLADDAKILLFKNGEQHPSWYPRVLSGIAAITKITVVSEDQVATHCEVKSKGVVSVRSFKQLFVHVDSLIYLPLYFHLSDISLLNSFKRSENLSLYESVAKTRTYTWNGDKIKKTFVVMIEPCQEVDYTGLKVTHVFDEKDLKILGKLLPELPRYLENEIGLFEVIRKSK